VTVEKIHGEAHGLIMGYFFNDKPLTKEGFCEDLSDIPPKLAPLSALPEPSMSHGIS